MIKKEIEHSFWEKKSPDSENELIKRVNELILISKKNCYSILQGNYITKIRGNGIEFIEARKYVYGESIRQIDWNITARMNEPYVRIFNEERQREVFIVLDVSSSMNTGWQSRKKIEYAVEIASSIAYSVISSKDKLGYITYSNEIVDFSMPSGKKEQFFKAVKTFYSRAVEEFVPSSNTDIREAVKKIQNLRGKHFMIFFISDFIDEDIPEDLKYLKGRHDVSMIHIYDPFEYTRMEGVSFIASSPEGKQGMNFINSGYGRSIESMNTFLKQETSIYNINFKSISTAEPVIPALRNIFINGKRG